MNGAEIREIGDNARVWSNGHVESKRSDSDKWRLLAVTLKNGKPTVVIQEEGRRVRHHVAALVLEAFVGPRPDGKKPIHKNGRKTDCTLDNLFWGERQRQSIFDEEVEQDLLMLGDTGINEVLRYYWGIGVTKKSIAEGFETEYRTVQHIIDTYSTSDRIRQCGLGESLQLALKRAVA